MLLKALNGSAILVNDADASWARLRSDFVCPAGFVFNWSRQSCQQYFSISLVLFFFVYPKKILFFFSNTWHIFVFFLRCFLLSTTSFILVNISYRTYIWIDRNFCTNWYEYFLYSIFILWKWLQTPYNFWVWILKI